MRFKIRDFTICIKPSFIVLYSVMVFLGFFEQFLMLFISVTLHECGHILMAGYFKLKPREIIITPIGQIAVIKDLFMLESYKKNAIILAGPFVNIIFFILFSCFNENFFVSWRYIHLSLALFNLLPLYPLDGGRILQNFLGNKIGVLSANKIVIKISFILSGIVFLSGFLQMILYSYNLSLLCLGLYFLKLNKKEYLNMNYEFYKLIIFKNKPSVYGTERILHVKYLFISMENSIKNILVRLCFDSYTVFYIHDCGQIRHTITETQLIRYIQVRGTQGTLSDVAMFCPV